ncbi:MAG TPA: ammonia channel protein, partial [Chitinophagales bacterium]|nr:ammonia channel protein [Chitinophagales bacterium]
GLVAITPAAGYVSYGPSLFIGFAASLISNYAVVAFKKTRIDDTLDVFPCHGVGGMMGMILTGVFAADYGTGITDFGLAYGQTKTFFAEIIALGSVAAYVFFGSYAIYYITNKIKPIRVSKTDEELGLDISQHGESYTFAKINL